MTDSPRSLDRIQRWMQAVITHPDGIETGIESQAAQEQIGVSADQIERVVTRSQSLDSISRLQVYGNAYYARLLECLRDEFPALLHALGEETFDAFAFGYLQTHPSTSYTLAQLSSRFPRYLRETRPRTEAEGGSPNWSDFLIELATLERTYSEVFDGPGVEGQALLQTDDLSAIPRQAWPNVRFQFVPCFRLLDFDFPVHEYATAVRRHQQDLVPSAAQPTFLAITRRDYIVRRAPVSRSQYELLKGLLEGFTLGDAIAIASELNDSDVDTLADSLQNWFKLWTTAGYFQSVVVTE